uniref:Capsid protein n=1 Tax=Bat astrovirus Ha/Guangxi/LS11/2007 TaxID=627525 RepID=C0KCU2_9VIRU|nr:capsid protein precursor [Bat astrovirus Ha/Guangxi/LS11/2007]
MAEAPKPQRVRRRRARKTSETKIDIKVTETDKPAGQNVQRRRRRNRRQRRPVFGPWPQGQGPRRGGRLRRAIKREIKREGLEGPRVSVQQRVSSTFGLVGPNSSGNVELELNFFLHPSLAKEANDGTSFGPVQALAAQYALRKLKFLRLIFTPMVGASAVSGTVIRASLNLSQSPGGTNWSGLGTRIHLDIHPGQKTVFNLRGDQIGGPRDGGWWLTDTNEEGSQSAGPIVEVHTLGKTTSTFQDKPWEGPLFIVEGIGLWQFANYQVKPALGMLERRQADAAVTLNATAGQPITMELNSTEAIAAFMINAEPEVTALASTSSVGETIFQVVDVGAQIAEVFSPPPFGWLIAGGWWFLKRAFGAARATPNGIPFYVYPSLSDAQNNRPAIAGATAQLVNAKQNANLIVTQVNAPNVGPQPTASAFIRAAVPVPMDFGTFRMHAEMFPEEVVSWVTDSVYYPNSYIIGKLFSNSTGNKSYLKTSWYVSVDAADSSTVSPPSNNGGYIHTLYVLHNVRFATPDGGVEYIPPIPKSGAALYYGDSTNSSATTYNKYGQVVATAHIASDVTPTAFLGMVFTLIKTDRKMIAHRDSRDHDIIWAQQAGSSVSERDKIKFSNLKPASGTPVLVSNIGFDAGDYLLGVSYAVGEEGKPFGGITQVAGTKVDISINFPFNSTGTTSATDAFFRMDGLTGTNPVLKIVPYALSGNIFAASSVDLNLNYVGRPSFNEEELLQKLKNLGVAFQDSVELPAFSEAAGFKAYIKEYLDLLNADGRLPTRSEIALRDGDYREALRIFRLENPL